MKARPILRRESKAPVNGKEISEGEKTYLEYLIENEPLLHEPFGILVDNDALPGDYVGKATVAHANSSQIQWGRILRHVSQVINFYQVERDVVEASVVTTVDGALKISAPYHLSRRKRHAVLLKPMRESCVQKAIFRRTGNSSDPATSWKLTAVSVGCGGTEKSELEINLLRLRGSDDISYQILSPLAQTYSLNGSGITAPPVGALQQTNVEVKIRSQEMEQNTVVLRYAQGDDQTSRTQLQFLADAAEGAGYVQTYYGTFSADCEAGMRSIVVEAVLRSSLYDTGAPVSTSYWVFPVRVHRL